MDSHEEATIAGNDRASQHVAPPDASLLAHGERLGRYTILELLGRGGMGLVYGAYDPQLDRRVAVKVLHASGPRSSGRARIRLVREAQAMARLSHPNVVAVHDTGTVDDEVFVAMEFVDGPTLRQWLDTKPRSVEEIVDVFVQAGRGLEAAHAAGMVHRDFKPTNVLLDVDGKAKVTDFGLVWTATPSEPPTDPHSEPDPAPSPIVTQGGMLGTPAYMAPEQHAQGPIDARADQFGFCVSLFDALYNKHPFPGVSLMEMIGSVTTGKRRPMPTDGHVPAHVRRAVWRGLEAEPDDRWPNMRALLDALLDDPRKRRRRWLQIGAGAVGLTALVGGTTWALTPSTTPAAAPPCLGAGDEIERVWSAQRRDAIAAAFAETEQPHAPALWQRSAGLVDAYAERWRASALDACRATRVRKEQSDSLFDLRRACLDRRLHELDTRLGLLTDLDDELLDRSFSIATGSAPIAYCEDFERLRQRVPPPDDPDQAATVARLGDEFDDLRVLREAGRSAQIEDRATDALSAANTTGYAPLQGQAHYMLAEIHEDLGRWKEAEATLKVAARYAAAGHDDYLLASLWVQLPFLVGYLQARADDADLLAPMAEAALARVDRPPSLVFVYESGMGTVRFRQGDRKGARRHYQAALEMTEPDSADMERRASIINNLAVLRMTDGDYHEARALFEQSMELRRGLMRPDHPNFADLHQNLANISVYLGEHEDALVRFDAALQIARAAEPEGGPRVIANLANRSLVLHELGHPQRARDDAEESLEIAQRLFGNEHPASMVTWANLARVERDTDNLGTAREAIDNAMRIANRALGEDHHDIGLFEFERGTIVALMGRTAEATELIDRALAKLEPSYGTDHPMLAEILRWRAQLHAGEGQTDAAIARYERAIKISAARPGDPREIARSRFGLAQLIVDDDPERAAQLVSLARTQWQQRGNADELRTLDTWIAAHPPSIR